MGVAPLRRGRGIPGGFVFQRFHADASRPAVDQEGDAVARFFDLAGKGRAGSIGFGIPSRDLNGLVFCADHVFDAERLAFLGDITENHVEAGFGIGIGFNVDEHSDHQRDMNGVPLS